MRELTVEEGVLIGLLRWQLALAQALEQRGHAATQRIAATSAAAGSSAPMDGAGSGDSGDNGEHEAAIAAVRRSRPARGHPEWETGTGLRLRWRPLPQREALVAELAQGLQAALLQQR
jgi:hypothetical protein